MSTSDIPAECWSGFGLEQAVDLARCQLYGFLSMLFGDPASDAFSGVLEKKHQRVAVAAADLLASEISETAELAPGERFPQQLDLRPVIGALEQPSSELIASHQGIFGLLLTKECPPNETEYCPSTLTFHRSQELADIAGFYEAFKVRPAPSCHERQDHISLELSFMAHLIGKEMEAAASDDSAMREKDEICRAAQRDFLQAHLAWWAPAFAELLRQQAKNGLYSALADALSCLIPFERSLLKVPIPRVIAKPQCSALPREEEPSGCL